MVAILKIVHNGPMSMLFLDKSSKELTLSNPHNLARRLSLPRKRKKNGSITWLISDNCHQGDRIL